MRRIWHAMTPASNTPSVPFLRWLLWHQFRINCIASVAIERPALKRFLPEDA